MLPLPFQDEQSDLAGLLPADLSGDFLIRVIDTDRGAGHTALDTVSVDELFVRVVP